MMKNCTKCGIAKESSEFYKLKNGKDKTWCKVCCKKASVEHNKRVRASTPFEIVKARDKANYVRNKEKMREASKTYAIKHPGKRKEFNAKYRAVPIKRARILYNKAKDRSRISGKEFNLTLGRIQIAMMLGVCEATGIPFDFNPPTKSHFNPFAPSIDKIDAFGGYTDINIQVVCNAYNIGKQQMSDAEFIEFCRIAVAEYDRKKALQR